MILIIDKEDKHQAFRNSLGRRGVPCVIPMVEEYNEKARKKVLVPIFGRRLFVAADDRQLRMVLDEIMYAKDVWKDATGNWARIPDNDFQRFLDGLEKRQKKAVKSPKAFNLKDAAEIDFFNLTANKFGLQVAIKQFGRDLRKEAEAA